MSKSEEGFAAVDAMVALAILAGTFAVGASALGSARRIAAAAAEMGAADATLRLVADQQPGTLGDSSGRSGRFQWRAQTVLSEMVASGPAICRRTAAVTSTRSGRRYELNTYVFCLPPEAKP